jgi:hypothetical protein
VGHNRSEDTCLHQVVAQEDLHQHTQEPQTAHCLNKAIMHSIPLINDNKQHINHVQTWEHISKEKHKLKKGNQIIG